MFPARVEYQICTKIGGVNIVTIYGQCSIESDSEFNEKWLNLGEFNCYRGNWTIFNLYWGPSNRTLLPGALGNNIGHNEADIGTGGCLVVCITILISIGEDMYWHWRVFGKMKTMSDCALKIK